MNLQELLNRPDTEVVIGSGRKRESVEPDKVPYRIHLSEGGLPEKTKRRKKELRQLWEWRRRRERSR